MPGASSSTILSSSSRLPWATNCSGSAMRSSGVADSPARSRHSLTALPKPPIGTFSSSVIRRPTERASPCTMRSSSGHTKRALTTVALIPWVSRVSAAASAGATRVPSAISATSPPARSVSEVPIGIRRGSRGASFSSGMLARG